MNRVINNPDLVVEDMLRGWLLAHADTVCATGNPRVVKRLRAPEPGKVGVITGGGSGHEPAFLGYVGDGMVDAVAIGEIFSSPTAKSVSRAVGRVMHTWLAHDPPRLRRNTTVDAALVYAV